MNRSGSLYAGFTHLCNLLQSPLLLLLRLIVGWQFFMAGFGKFSQIAQIAQFFSSLNIPLPEVAAYLVATIELVAGALIFIGLFSRLAALLLSCVMVGALSTAHIDSVKVFFENQKPLFGETAFVFLIILLVILAFGPGLFSLDYLICRKCRTERG